MDLERLAVEEMARRAWEYADVFINQYLRRWPKDEYKPLDLPSITEIRDDVFNRPQKTDAEKAAIRAETKETVKEQQKITASAATAIFTMLLQEGIKEQREKEKPKPRKK